MDINKVFLGVITTVVAVVAIMLFIGKFNVIYGTELPPELDTLNNTVVGYSSSIGDISQSVSNTTQIKEGAGQDSAEEGILTNSYRAFSSITELIGLVPALIEAGGLALGIPEFYVKFARYAFIVIFALAIAYLLLLGVRRLI